MSTVGGGYLGGELVKNSGRVRSTETRATTDVVTNQFTDSGDPIGGGVVVGYNFSPWGNVIVGPFASFDWLNQTINHTFTGGSFLGTTTHWMITAGAKGGITPTPGLFVYGLAGVSWLNQDLNINFGGPVMSSNTTVPGVTLGLGGEYKPSFLQGFGVPVSVFAQYQHTWWQDGTLTTPAASPLFNYAFRREDDTFKLGFNVYFGVPTAALPSSPMFVKALPAR